MVTSGDYQRYFIGSDGQRYHHIINPATGYPSESGLISATVVADSSMVADALSTALFVAGLHQGISLLGTVPGIEAILITADLRVHITPGLIDSFVAQKGINVNIIYRKAEKPKSGVVYLKDKKVKERKGRRTGKMIGWTIALVIMAAIGIGAAIGMPKLSRVESGRVTKVEFLQSKENQKPEFTNTLINRVIEAQSLQVDAISGATLTSKAYLQGIENALKGAMAGESK